MKTFQATVFAVFALLAFSIPGVMATTQFDGTDVCRELGQRYDVATWVWTGTTWELEYQRPGANTLVTGDATAAVWNSASSVPAAYAITATGATEIGVKARDGTATGPGLTAIVLCSRGSSGGGSNAASVPSVTDGASEDEIEVPVDTEIPEFSNVLAIGAVSLLCVGLIARKRA